MERNENIYNSKENYISLDKNDIKPKKNRLCWDKNKKVVSELTE